MSRTKNELPELTRHREARLARELGLAPNVELRGFIRIKNGKLVGVFIGPRDFKEMLRVKYFTLSPGADRRVGSLHGIEFYCTEKDVP